MELDYSNIFNVFVDIISKAAPVGIFMYLLDVLLYIFFSLAFPKRFKRGE